MPVLWASGATRREFQLQVPIAIGWIGALWAVAQTGSLIWLSWAVCLLFHVRAGVIIAATLKAVAMAPGELVAACRAGAGVAVLVGLAGLVADRGFGRLLGPGIGLLAIDIAACGLAFLVGLRVMRSAIGDDLELLLRQVAGRLPSAIGGSACCSAIDAVVTG